MVKVGKDNKPTTIFENKIPKEPKFHVVDGNLIDEKGNIVFKARKEYAPHALQVVDTPNGMMTFNPNTQTMTPLMANGKPIMGTKGNLPEGATGQVTGVQNVISALGDLKNKINTNKPSDMLNPNKRALMSTEYQNVVLQLKEAMKLGVLNGNDYQILTSMITDPNDPKALLISKETQLQQIDNLNKKLNDMTKNVYKTHQREVPTNLMPTNQSGATESFNGGSLADMAKQELARRTRQ